MEAVSNRIDGIDLTYAFVRIVARADYLILAGSGYIAQLMSRHPIK